jgi:hypothetical protein
MTRLGAPERPSTASDDLPERSTELAWAGSSPAGVSRPEASTQASVGGAVGTSTTYTSVPESETATCGRYCTASEAKPRRTGTAGPTWRRAWSNVAAISWPSRSKTRCPEVVQRGERLRLTRKPGKPVGIVRKRVGEDFERDIAMQLRIARAIDLPHAPFADRRGDVGDAKSGAGGKAKGAGDYMHGALPSS